MFFESWSGLGRVAIAAIIGYAALLFALRVSGKRTLSKMNAFDLVVTVALGSTLATMILSRSAPLAEGILALAMLVAIQFVVAWSCARSKLVESIVKSQPTLVFYQGQLLESVLRRERLTPSEVLAAIRSEGLTGVERVEAVILETDGELSVLAQSKGTRTALANVNPEHVHAS